MKLLHIADIHLDRAFHSAETRRGATTRRRELRDALTRMLDLGRERRVDAVCIAGDVYEHEYVTEDTVAFLRGAFAAAAVPVLVTPGNHDPHVPGSVWERTEWPSNVQVFRRDVIEPHELPSGMIVWGAAFTAAHCTTNVVRDWTAPRDGRLHLLLIHAALTGEQWAAEPRHRPVTRAQLEATGVRFVMLGHFHDGRADDFLCYPGSPEPLGFGERRGRHAAALLEVSEAGAVACELVEVARRRYVELAVGLDGATGSAEIEARLTASLTGQAGASVLVTLEGEVAPGCEIDAVALAEGCRGDLAELSVRDRTHAAYDLRALAGERSVRGRFVARMLGRTDPGAQEALVAGLRSLDGRRDLVA